MGRKSTAAGEGLLLSRWRARRNGGARCCTVRVDFLDDDSDMGGVDNTPVKHVLLAYLVVELTVLHAL